MKRKSQEKPVGKNSQPVGLKKKKKPYVVELHTNMIYTMVEVRVIKNAVQPRTKGKH